MNVILIRFSSLGDCVLLCPLAAHLARAGARVTVVTKRTYVEIFAAATGVNRILALDAGAGLRGLAQIAGSLRNDADIVIDAHNNWRSRALCGMLGGTSIRFEKHYRSRLGLIVFKRAREVPTMLERYAHLAEILGHETRLAPGGLTIPASIVRRCDERLGSVTANMVAVAPGSRWPMKRWPVDRYLELARRIIAGGKRRIVLVGDADDAELCRVFLTTLGDSVVDATGSASILETAGYISRASGFVGNDSGLMHLAEAVGTPVVGLFGPTVRAFGYYPALPGSAAIERQLSCRPCSRNGAVPCPRGTQECMTGIPVDVVEGAVSAMLGGDVRASVVLE
ncbi:MAG: glycosyltransferase family 9 protein [Candidatus Krumholzibacteriota bacterium]|nr:glycosyltransferase family 9 protein [Candidatus Krumholzibacteriota bacterium]